MLQAQLYKYKCYLQDPGSQRVAVREQPKNNPMFVSDSDHSDK